jgi:hypothetical protein
MDRHDALRLKQEQRNQERELALQQKQDSIQRKKKIIWWSVGSALAIILVISGVAFAMPGRLDAFAKCLSEKEAVMYGAIEWCSFTQEQAGMFGKSFKFVNYRDYHELPGIKKTPTWQINGALYENVQSLQRLSAITGCPL